MRAFSFAMAVVMASHGAVAVLRGSTDREMQISLDSNGISFDTKKKGGDSGISVGTDGITIPIPGGDGVRIDGNGIHVGAPGTTVNVSPDTGVTVNTPGANVSVGTDGVRVETPAGINGISNLTCSALRDYDVNKEKSCKKAFSAFYNGTESFGDMTKTERKKVITDFCETKCGKVYTASVLARELKCSETEDTDTDAESEPEVFKIDTSRLPTDYPGLELGCMKDATDSEYCGLKRADLEANKCAFYNSCCYASYAKVANLSKKAISKIDKACPGSRDYLERKKCAA